MLLTPTPLSCGKRGVKIILQKSLLKPSLLLAAERVVDPLGSGNDRVSQIADGTIIEQKSPPD